MKTLTSLIAALALSTMIAVTVEAATLTCTVEKVEGNVITMDCGDKAATLAVGMEVKVKAAASKKAAIEGC